MNDEEKTKGQLIKELEELRMGASRDVTERNEAGDALRASEERFRLLADTIEEVFWMADIEINRMYYISPGYEHVWGQTRQNLYDHPKSFIEAIHPADRERVLAGFAVKKSGQPFDHEYRIIRPDGPIRWIWDRGFPVKSEKGQVSHYVGVASDITARKQAEEALERERREYQTILDAAPVMIAYKSKDDHLIKMNTAFAEFMGSSKEKLLGLTTFDLVKPREVAQQVRDHDLEVIRTGKPVLNQLVKLSGPCGQKVIWAIYSKLPFHDSDGSIIGTVSFVIDVDERKKAEEALRESETRFRDLAELLPEIVFEVDQGGLLGFANQNAFKSFGYTPEDLAGGLNVLDMVTPADRGRALENMQRLMNGEDISPNEYLMRRKDGSVFPSLVSSTTIIRDGQPVGLRGFIVDITERKRAEQALLSAHRKIADLLEGISDAFFALNNDLVVTYFNAAAARVLGRKPEEVLGFPLFDAFPEARGSVFEEQYRTAIREKEFRTFEVFFDIQPYRNWYDVRVYPQENGISVFFQITTHRKEAEERLKESEERFRILVEQAPEAITVYDVDLDRLVDANTNAVKLFGCSREELLQSGIWRFYAPVQPDGLPLEESISENVKRTLAGEKLVFERAICNAQGQDLICEVRLVVLPSAEHKLIRNSFVDISGRKRAEAALQESEEQFRLLVENAPDAIFIQTQGHFAFVNKSAVGLFGGRSPNQFIGQPVIDRFHPDCHETVRERIRLLNEEGKEVPLLEEKCLKLNGTSFDVEVSAVPFLYKNQKGALVFFRDITERKRVEEALKEREEKYWNLFNNAEVGIFRSRLDGSEVLEVNRKFLDIVGRTLEETLGKPSVNLWSEPKEREEMAKGLVADGSVSAFEYKMLNKRQGDVRNCLTSLRLYREQGILEGSILDITELRRAEEEKEKLEGQLRLAQRMEAIGTLAGGIAHDFNNILTPILMGTELAQLTIAEESPAQDHLQKVIQAAHRAKELVRQILVFSRQGNEEKRPFRLIPVLKEVIKLIRSSLPSTIEINQHIGPVSDIIISNPIQIHQVIMNLCTNAAHAMREQGGTLEIVLTNQTLEASDLTRKEDLDPGDFIVLTVRDTGTGMDSRTRERIFDPFFTTKERGEGTGMGLSVVHGIVTGIKGAITVDSEPNQGTTFHVYIPCVKEKIIEEPEKNKQVPRGTERILFVDDEITIGNLYKTMLERLGYQVDNRSDALEAWDYFRENPDKFDLVITDQTMPKMTGLELAEGILRLRPDLPIILCTGFSLQDVAKLAKRAGVEEILFKPIAGPELSQLIRKILDLEVLKKSTPIA